MECALSARSVQLTKKAPRCVLGLGRFVKPRRGSRGAERGVQSPCGLARILPFNAQLHEVGVEQFGLVPYRHEHLKPLNRVADRQQLCM
jgi:hypothetical protein